jgi:DNA topoisomerase-1
VQSVALRLVCEREKAIGEFVPEEYWRLGARVAKRVEPRSPFVVRLAQVDGEKAKVPNEAAANALREDLDERELRVRGIVRRELVRRALPPYITSSLQQAASRALGFTPARTMRIAQSLYEGVDLGEGPVGLITYMRTDSVAVAQEAQSSARSFIEKTYGAAYVPPKPNVYRSRASAQEAHEAIRPTDVTRTPDTLSGRLKPDEWRLYRLIWERFVASQMSPAIIGQRTVEVEAVRRPTSLHDFLFRATASEIVFPGYLKVAGADAVRTESKGDNGEEEAEEALPPLEEGEALDRLEWLAEQKFTQPPPRYSEATLVRALEENGIGRPSTYAQTLSTLTERGYVSRQKRQLVPTPLGLETNEFLVAHLGALFNVEFTAQMEEALDKIEEGSLEWTKMLGDFYERLKEWLQQARGPAGNATEARDLIEALAHVREWRPPPEPLPDQRRAYAGDQAFYESLRKQWEAGEKPLSARQVEALRQLTARYRDQAPELKTVAERWDIPLPDSAPAGPPPATTLRKLALLENAQFEPPRKVGRRVFDDRAFYQSLKRQAQGGRQLSDRQERYLDRLLAKYSEQIPHFETVAAELGLGDRDTAEKSSANPAEVERLLSFFEGVTDWKPPRKRGRRTWDDQEFVRSVGRQFRTRGSITPKQLQALHKLAARYEPM